MSSIIYTTGYPRSGTWWITRLLSDLLDSPIKTLPPDDKTITDFCQTGQGGYTILKTHLRGDEWDGDGKVVFIQRDPRDVAVSAMHYLNISLSDTIENMCIESDAPFDVKRHIYHKPGWYKEFVQGWLDLLRSFDVWECRYYLLHAMPTEHLYYLVRGTTRKRLSLLQLNTSYERQRFEQHQHKYPHAMRKGIVGDWQNHFEQHHGEMITEHLGELMLGQGYVTSLDWWKEL